MWQLIEANKRKSTIFLIMLAILLFIVIHMLIEAFIFNVIEITSDNIYDIYVIGLIISIVIFLPTLIFNFFKAFSSGYQEILSRANAIKCHDSENVLKNVVEEMCIASGFHGKPEIYIIDCNIPNAFAVGTDEKKCAIAVSSSLLKILNREELQAVVAHEMAHLYNRDSLFMTLACFLLGTILSICAVVNESMFGGIRSRSSSRSRTNPIFLLICLVLVILSPIVGKLLYFMTSREREYLADACAVQFTRNPGALASALTKISSVPLNKFKVKSFEKSSEGIMPLYINNPAAADDKDSWFSTHPPVKKRIAILLKLSHGSIIDYEKAYSQVCKSNLFSKEMLKESIKIGNPLTSSSVAGGIVMMGVSGISTGSVSNDSSLNGIYEQSVLKPKELLEKKRIVNNMVWESVKYTIVNCECDTTLKIPPCYMNMPVKCPHCGKIHTVSKS